MCKCLGLQLSKIWTATHEKESFISLFFKPAYQILENKENVRVSALKQRVYHVLCLCIKNHNHEFGKKPAVKTMVLLHQWNTSYVTLLMFISLQMAKIRCTDDHYSEPSVLGAYSRADGRTVGDAYHDLRLSTAS